MKLLTIDILFIILYLGVLLIIGMFYIFKTNNSQKFMLGDGLLKGWVVGLANGAAQNSSIAYVTVSVVVFTSNIASMGNILAMFFIGVLASKFAVPFFRKYNSPSAYAFLSDRFGKWAMVYASIMFLTHRVFRMGLIIYFIAIILAPLTGMDEKSIVLLTSVIVALYTYMGGLRAVIWTEFLQCFIIVIALVGMVLFVVDSLPYGWSQFMKVANAGNKFSFGSLDFDLSQSSVWAFFILGLFSDAQEFCFNQMFVQRYLAIDTEEGAKTSAWLGMGSSAVIFSLISFMGISLYVFYSVHLTDLINFSQPQDILSHFIADYLPSGLKGIVLVSILGATMSSIDSTLIAGSTLVLTSLYMPFKKNEPMNDRSALKILHISSLFICIIGVLITFILFKYNSFISNYLMIWFDFAGILYGGIMGLFLLGLLSKKIGNKIAVISLIVGSVVSVMVTISSRVPPEWNFLGIKIYSLYNLCFGTIAMLITGFGLSLFVSSKSR